MVGLNLVPPKVVYAEAGARDRARDMSIFALPVWYSQSLFLLIFCLYATLKLILFLVLTNLGFMVIS